VNVRTGAERESGRPRDWTLDKYRELVAALLGAGYVPQAVEDYLRAPAARPALLRHDVDRRPRNALAMARLEHALGVRSTYYVRTTRSVLSPALVRELAALGHEVGYHYEVLSRTRGDRQAARRLFAAELASLRELVPIATAAAHGSPLSPWNNLDLWDSGNRPANFSLAGEAYLDIDYGRVAYYTDTGRSWASGRTNLRDRPGEGSGRLPTAHGTDELIELVAARAWPACCVQTHPERWSGSLVGLAGSAAFDYAVNSAKLLIRALRPADAR